MTWGAARLRAVKAFARVAAVAVATAGWSPGSASAETAPDLKPPRWHLFFGLDGAEQSFFGHGGLVWAPAGDLHHAGWRLRAGANGGVFEYLSGTRDITGQLLAAELLPGFQWIGKDAGLTAFAGATVQDQTTDPRDQGKLRQGTRFGAKVLIEGWYRPADGIFLNASGSYASAVQSYSTRLSASFRVAPRFAVEPEIAAFGEPGYDQQRLGLLFEYRHGPRRSFKLGGGWAIDPDGGGPYAAIQFKLWR